MVIQTENLKKNYGDVHALRGVDLNIAGGGVVGLLGPNGAGKTTLVETIEGLRDPSAGRLNVLGLDPAKQAKALKEKLGVLLQHTELPPELTATEVLSTYSAFFEKSVAPEEALSRVTLEEKADARVDSLSGGQKQRLAIGLALINDPELIILDEPTTGLDPVARRGVHKIVSGFREQGRTVLLTTHYIEEAEKLCDRVIMIKAGQIVADGTPFELLGRSGGASTLWIDVEGEFDPTALVQSGLEPQGREGGHYKFSTTSPAEAVIALGETLKTQNVTLTDLRLKRPTLEDVYLELVGDVGSNQ